MPQTPKRPLLSRPSMPEAKQMEWDIIKNELAFICDKAEWYRLTYEIRCLDKKLVPWTVRVKMSLAKVITRQKKSGILRRLLVKKSRNE